MLFNSWEFLVLLAVTIPLYYLPVPKGIARPWQVGVLLLASAIFYAWEEPELLILLFGSCAFNCLSVERILHCKLNGLAKQAYRWLWISVVLNLAFLAFFKYAGIFYGLLPTAWVSPAALAWIRAIPLPVGISFYTFHAISLLVDVHRNKVSEETQLRLGRRGSGRITSLGDLTLYIVFFPQLVAGPIVKAHNFVDQIREKIWNDIPWASVRRYVVTGYFLKIFVADNLSEQTSTLTLGIKQLEGAGPLNLLPLLYAYGLQIFADFAGYSLIAIGFGLIFGYRLPENFNFPYLSTSITEFWRRWHLSLSAWLRDYLYIPLGGNQKGPARTYINLFLVMFLGGLWHGAEWKFALWGTLHGIFLALERFVGGKTVTRMKAPSSVTTSRGITGFLASITCWFLTFHAVTLLWLTFLMPDLAHIVAFFKGVTNGRWGLSGPPAFALAFYGSAVVLYHAWGWLKEHRQALAARLGNSWLEPMAHAVMIFLVLTNPGAPRGFIYFQF